MRWSPVCAAAATDGRRTPPMCLRAVHDTSTAPDCPAWDRGHPLSGWFRPWNPGTTCALSPCTRCDRRLGSAPTRPGQCRHVLKPLYASRANDELDTRPYECTAEWVHRAFDG